MAINRAIIPQAAYVDNAGISSVIPDNFSSSAQIIQ
jgi:hypothetical protein